MILATTALRISEVAGLQVGDVDLPHGLLTVRRQTYPGRGGLVTKETKGRGRRPVPIIEPLRATLERLTAWTRAGEKRPALRHTALTWMADAVVRTVAVAPALKNVATLGLIVLSFSLEI
jgi:integrase